MNIQSPHPTIGGATTGAPFLKAETLMLNVQLLVAKDYDEQMRHVSDQIRFLSGLKKSYRDHISKIQSFLTENSSSSRKDGKKYIEASYSQMAELCGALTVSDYDLETMTSSDKGLSLPTTGDRHGLDDADANGITWAPNKDGKMDAHDLENYFANGAAITDPKEATEYAKRAGSDDNGLFFYFGHQNNVDDNGMPKFAVFVDQLEKLTEQLKDKLSGVEEDAEQLGAKLTQLTNQRKAALDGANQLITKMEQIRSNTIGKMA